MLVNLKILSFKNNENGTITLDLPDRILTEQENELIEKLFPHTSEEIRDALDKEVLLMSQATPAQVKAEPDGVHRQQYVDRPPTKKSPPK